MPQVLMQMYKQMQMQMHELGWGAKFGPEGSSIIGSPSGNPE